MVLAGIRSGHNGNSAVFFACLAEGFQIVKFRTRFAWSSHENSDGATISHCSGVYNTLKMEQTTGRWQSDNSDPDLP